MRRANVALLAIALCALTSSCATHYNRYGLNGGYSDFALDSNTYRVEFTGNLFTSEADIDSYVMRRCAEVTLAETCDYFVLASPIVVVPRKRTAIIKAFKGAKPADILNAYDARDVLAHTARPGKSHVSP